METRCATTEVVQLAGAGTPREDSAMADLKSGEPKNRDLNANSTDALTSEGM
jgi:hypothetical protein